MAEPRTLCFCFELRSRSSRTPRPKTNTADSSGREMNAAKTKLATAKAALTEPGSERRRDFSHKKRTEMSWVFVFGGFFFFFFYPAAAPSERAKKGRSRSAEPLPGTRRCKRKLRAMPPLRDAVLPQWKPRTLGSPQAFLRVISLRNSRQSRTAALRLGMGRGTVRRSALGFGKSLQLGEKKKKSK